MEEIFFDLETKKWSTEVEGGWNNIRAFGMVLTVTWDEVNGCRTWLEDDAEKLVTELGKAEKIIGFNNLRFDNEVLTAYVPNTRELLDKKSFDILAYIYPRLGFRVSLDNLCSATLNAQKSASAEEAIRWFRAGEIAKVVEYCQRDVELTRDLYRYGQEHGCIYYPSYGQREKLTVSW